MKQKVRRALAVSGMAIAIGASGLTLNASANTLPAGRSFRTHHQIGVEKITHASRMERWNKTAGIRRVIPGIVSQKTGDSLTITRGSKTFAVVLSDTTRIVNQKWATIDLSKINTGDKVRVVGTISGDTIIARTIRDISIQ